MIAKPPGVVSEALARAPADVLHEGERHAALRGYLDRAAALLRPSIEAIVDDRSVSFDRALVIVVIDPSASADTGGEPPVLAQYAFANAGDVDVDYAHYAIGKAVAAHRGGCDTSLLRERAQSRGESELPLIGGLHRRGLAIGVSGAMPVFDEAIGVMFVELVHALQQHRATSEPSLPERNCP